MTRGCVLSPQTKAEYEGPERLALASETMSRRRRASIAEEMFATQLL